MSKINTFSFLLQAQGNKEVHFNTLIQNSAHLSLIRTAEGILKSAQVMTGQIYGYLAQYLCLSSLRLDQNTFLSLFPINTHQANFFANSVRDLAHDIPIYFP